MSVRLEMSGHVAIVSLAAVEQRNALSRPLVAALLDALEDARARSARALVLAGDGPAFCAGADINDLLAAGWMEATPTGPTPTDVFEVLDREPRVVVAAATGAVLGGGFELTLCCDLVIAGSDAMFGLPELGHGVIPNTAMALLGRLIGQRRALELVLTRRRVAAQEALALGLVTAVVPTASARDTAVALAQEIVSGAPPGAIAAAKRGLRHGVAVDWGEVRASLGRLPRREWTEGLGAFRARRRPDYEEFWREHAAAGPVSDL